MKTPAPDSQGQIEKDTIRSELGVIKIELDGLKKDLVRVGHAENHIKWLMGTLMTIAILLIGGNWISSKSNYDRDRQLFQDQSALVSKQLLQEQDVTIRLLSDKMVTSIGEKFAALNAGLISNSAAMNLELDRRFNAFTNLNGVLTTEFQKNIAALIKENQKDIAASWAIETNRIAEIVANLTDELHAKLAYFDGSQKVVIAEDSAKRQRRVFESMTSSAG
jgi:hypothetical protein